MQNYVRPNVGKIFMNEIKITRRHLPHWSMDDCIYFVTFCAEGDMLNEDEQRIVLEHIKNGDGKYYDCYAVMVMPDHVHVLLQTKKGMTLSRVMHGIKGTTAHIINLHRNTRGRIWQKESYDRIMRDSDEFHEKFQYMYNNPVRKGLIENPEKYVGWWCNENKCG